MLRRDPQGFLSGYYFLKLQLACYPVNDRLRIHVCIDYWPSIVLHTKRSVEGLLALGTLLGVGLRVS